MLSYLLRRASLLACLSGCVTLSASPLLVDVTAPSAILIDAENGSILFEKEAFAPHYPASITKIATALYLLECKGEALEEVATASQEAMGAISSDEKRRRNYNPPHRLEFGGTHMNIKRGEQLSLETLLYGLMLESGNDAANVIAEHISGSVPAFMESLKARLTALGATRTHLLNPHGLHHPDQLTCAHDMALIAKEAMRYPLFREVVATVVAPRPSTALQPATKLYTHNALLKRRSPYYYSHAIGIKNGYTSAAKGTLVAAASNGRRSLIAVLLNSEGKNRFSDAATLFEAAFKEPEITHTLLHAADASFSCDVKGAASPLIARLDTDITATYYPSLSPTFEAHLLWKGGYTLPIKEGEVVATLNLQKDGQPFCVIPLVATCDLLAIPPGRTSHLIYGVAGIALALFLIFLIRRHRR